ncbi:FmdB family zinc ribbon protein [Planctomicrobium sp. SH668]|uniref:FmdB family zinc ribbon protein n=1 Tax=Planctomicrobium sp. SH668 TaxID=3448126 RepID=UPI003F5BA589
MPIFEYRCSECGTDSEVFVRGQETPVCSACSGTRLEKLMSAPAGHVAGGDRGLPVMGSCPPSNAPPCMPGCCRIPQ